MAVILVLLDFSQALFGSFFDVFQLLVELIEVAGVLVEVDFAGYVVVLVLL